MNITKQISPLIATQFPAIYREEGPAFVEFVKAYFEWMEEYGPLSDSRSLLSYRDIDTTLDQFLNNFIAKYMVGLPIDIVGDKRTLQKHISELFASKGSPRGLQLLFRLIFNADSSIYTPGDDVLRTSDGEWKIPTFIEVTDEAFNALFSGEDIVGAQSGAKAIVESYERRTVLGRLINIMFLSNVRGNFTTGERITTSLVAPEHSPVIIGPLTDVTMEVSALDYQPGDVLDVSSTYGEGGKAVVTKTGVRAGTIAFTLVDGGMGYSVEYANTTVTGNDGTGADFDIVLGATTPFITSTVAIQAFANVTLDSPDYGLDPLGVTDENSTIEEGIAPFIINIGPIASLTHINPGEGYTGNIAITARDELLSGYQLDDGLGGIQGDDSVITGRAQFGSGVIEQVKVIDSGLGFREGAEVLLSSNSRPDVASGTAHTNRQGTQEGFWTSTRGFLNSDKFIHDSYYYQEYSYEVRSNLALNKYSELLRRIWHPAGTEMFGAVAISTTVDSSADVVSSSVA